jgi:hypothetical protein
MPRKSATQRQPVEPPSLPEVLIPPTEAKENERSAYWIQMASNKDEFSAAIKSEDIWNLLSAIPDGLWGETLRLYLYRKPDDEGVMVKNPPGEFKYVHIFYKPVDQDFISARWGGGKYQLRLNWIQGKENTTIKQQTFDIYGPPKIQPGQVVELDGKPVPVTGVAAAPPVDASASSDVARVIDAMSEAQKSANDINTHASKTAIDMVRAQAEATANAKDPVSLALEIVAALKPAAPAVDPMAAALGLVEKIDAMVARRNPQPVHQEEPKDPPLAEAMTLVETMTGRSFADILHAKPARPATEENPLLAVVAPIAEKFFGSLPAILAELRYNKDQEFRRAVWLKTATAGQAPPPELLAANSAPPSPPQPTRTAQPATPQPAANRAPSPGEISEAIAQTICQRFDKSPEVGYQTGAMIDGLFGDAIEALGLDKYLSSAASMKELIAGHPDLALRSRHARWREFEEDLMAYMLERWGIDGEDDVAMAPAPVPEQPRPRPASTVVSAGPQPVA